MTFCADVLSFQNSGASVFFWSSPTSFSFASMSKIPPE